MTFKADTLELGTTMESIYPITEGVTETWHSLFRTQVCKNPDRAAVKLPNGESVSYAQLDGLSDRIAGHLRTIGIGKGTTVATYAHRELLESVSFVVGALKAGTCVFQLEPSLSTQVIREKLETVRPEAVLSCDAGFSTNLKEEPFDFPCQIVTTEQSVENWPIQVDASRRNAHICLSDPAFLIMSSGTTGKPKLMTIPYRPLSNLAEASNRLLGMGPGSTLLQISNKNFDAGTFELIAPLATGAAIGLIPEEARLNGAVFAKFLELHRADIFIITPSHIRSLSRQLCDKGLKASVRSIMLIGEAFDASLLEQLDKWGAQKIYNSYGPSEIGFWATTKLVYSRETDELRGTLYPIEIGIPIRGVRCLVMKEKAGSWSFCRPGETGFLFLNSGTDRVYRDDALNDLRYVALPFARGNRKYLNTGDLVRWEAETLTFVGRWDNQVKIRGQLVVTDEVANRIAQISQEFFPDLRTQWHIEPQTDGVSCNRLKAYFTVPNRALASQMITRLVPILNERMERYKVPSLFYWIAEFKPAPGGKLDVAQLQKESERVVPASKSAGKNIQLARSLRIIWKKYLGMEELSDSESFFNLGGDSLNAVCAASEISEKLRADEARVRKLLFDGSSIDELASSLAIDLFTKDHTASSVPQRLANRSELAATPMQEQILFAARLGPDARAYSEPATIIFDAFVDEKAMGSAFRRVIRRHEALRTSFRQTENGHHLQIIHPYADADFEVGFDDLRHLAAHQQEEVALALARQDISKPFDTGAFPLFRARLIRTEEKKDRLFLCFHHAIMDGHTMEIMLRELEKEYLSVLNQLPFEIDPDQLQYGDFSVWYRDCARKLENEQLRYWKGKLADPPVELFVRPPGNDQKQTTEGGIYTFHLLPTVTVEVLKTIGQARGVTLFTLLLTAYKILLYRQTGRNDIAVGTVSSMRKTSSLNQVMGNMLNTLVLRTRLPEDGTFKDYLKAVNTVCIEAKTNQETPFSEVVKHLKPGRNEDPIPLFQTAFIMEPKLAKSGRGWSLSQMEIYSGSAKIALSIELDEREWGIIGRAEYKKSHFGEKFPLSFVEAYRSILTDLAQQGDLRVPSYHRVPLPGGRKQETQVQKAGGPDEISSLPALPIRTRIARIFSEVLSVDQGELSDESDFYDLGGDSLLSVVLIDRINKEFTLGLSLSEMRNKFTLFEMSRTVAIHATRPKFSKKGNESKSPDEILSLVLLRSARTPCARNAFFFIHPGDGSTRVFESISQEFPQDCEVYGLRSPGSEVGEAMPDFTVEQFAQRYADLVVKQQPQGEIQLGSFCAGGLIALAMVPLLEQKGRLVSAVILIDCPPPQHQEENIDTAQRLHDFFRLESGLEVSPRLLRIVSDQPEEQLRYLVRIGRNLGIIKRPFEYYLAHLQVLLNLYRPEGVKDIIINSFRSVFGISVSPELLAIAKGLDYTTDEIRLVELLMREGKAQKKIPVDLDLAFFAQICQVANAINHAVRKYVPQKISSQVPVLFLYTKPSPISPMPWYANPAHWSELIPNMTAIRCEGDHFSVLTREPLVRALYRKIAAFRRLNGAKTERATTARLSAQRKSVSVSRWGISHPQIGPSRMESRP